MITYLKKAILVKDKKENILVISDLHLGNKFFDVAGKIILKENYDRIVESLNDIFENISEHISKIIILGDLKDSFSNNTTEERNAILNLIKFLQSKCKEIIIIKGNHDNFIINVFKNNLNVKIYDKFILDSYCFLHGDRDFLDIYEKKIKFWFIGHMHPPIQLDDGNKSEKYKCFLEGKYKRKKIIILPSFSEQTYGINILENKSNLVWNFKFLNFKVKIISDNGEILNFGVVRNIKK